MKAVGQSHKNNFETIIYGLWALLFGVSICHELNSEFEIFLINFHKKTIKRKKFFSSSRPIKNKILLTKAFIVRPRSALILPQGWKNTQFFKLL